MPLKDRERDMHALRNLIDEAHAVVSTIELPQGRSNRAAKLLTTALAMVDDLIAQPAPAAVMGAKGGNSTAKKMLTRDPDYYKRIAAMRKTKAGGRPKSK